MRACFLTFHNRRFTVDPIQLHIVYRCMGVKNTNTIPLTFDAIMFMASATSLHCPYRNYLLIAYAYEVCSVLVSKLITYLRISITFTDITGLAT